MANFKDLQFEELQDECIRVPQTIKKTVYHQPARVSVTYQFKPKLPKGKVFTMDEKFEYVLAKIDPSLQQEFAKLPLSSKGRITKLYNSYHEWKWPILSNQLYRMGKELKFDAVRIVRLLQVAKLITNNKDMLGKTPYHWQKLSFTSEEVLETLILERDNLTQWEKQYYTAHNRYNRKKRAKKADEGRAFTETVKRMKSIEKTLGEEMTKEPSEKPIKACTPAQPQTLSENTEAFISDLGIRYKTMQDLFPIADKDDLRKIFLQLILQEYEV